MKIILILIFTVLSNILLADELKFKNIYFLDKNLEISGMITDSQNNLLFISDNKEDEFIYKLSLNDKKTYLTEPFIKINDLKNFQEYYYSTLLSYKGERWIKSPWDLEGIARCGNTIFLANEQVREIIKLDLKEKTLKVLDINTKVAFIELGVPLENIPTNAGFEGVSVDCENNILYIAQERNPRAIFSYNLKNNQYLGLIKTESLKNTQISPDYSDLFYLNGFLYILERNEWNILKLDPKTKEIVKTYSFENNPVLNLRKLYKTDEPYGLAESLLITDDEIIIGIDNNKKPLSKRAEILFNFRGNSSSVIHFERPKDL